MEMIGNIRVWLQGKKTYITAAIGLLGAIVAWADGQINLTGLLAAMWAAVQVSFIRAGINNGKTSADSASEASSNSGDQQ